jgi:hypothetical protein
MELTQIIITSGVAFIAAAAIATYLLNKKKTTTSTQLPYNASKTIDEELVIRATGTDEFYIPIENSTKPKKKRKYYPKKPKTSI